MHNNSLMFQTGCQCLLGWKHTYVVDADAAGCCRLVCEGEPTLPCLGRGGFAGFLVAAWGGRVGGNMWRERGWSVNMVWMWRRGWWLSVRYAGTILLWGYMC